MWGTEVPGAGTQRKLLALIQMGDWCGALCSDAKDYDITGAMFVNDDGDDIFNAIFWQGFVWGIDTGWLMGDPIQTGGASSAFDTLYKNGR